MKSSNSDVTEITLPKHKLNVTVNGELVKSVEGIVMDNDQTVDITVPEVKMDFDKIYPIGSVYISVASDFDPNTAFSGTTWQKFGQGRCLWGADDGDTIVPYEDSAIDAGLPNITGKSGANMENGQPKDPQEVFTAIDSDQAWASGSKSALYLKWATNAAPDPDGDHIKTSVSAGGIGSTSGAGFYGMGFNASRCNAIYGNSTTVQPPAIKVIFWKRTS